MKIITRDNNERPMRYPIRSIFDDFFTPSIWETQTFFNTPTLSADLWEEKDDVFVKMALPGISKEDIKINIMADTVSISGHTKKEEKSDDDSKKYYFRSMESSYEQSFNLPTKIDPDKAEAEFKDGVLTIKMPKANEVKPKQIEIK
jgi:HSP20 family protein